MNDNDNTINLVDAIGRFEHCPVCDKLIDMDEVDVNNNTEDGYGQMAVDYDCPHCGTELRILYDAQNGYAFDRIEIA